MNLFELKRVADKLLTNFPYKKHGSIGVHIQSSSIRVTGNGDALTVIMHSDILTENERNLLVYEVSDEDIYSTNTNPPDSLT